MSTIGMPKLSDSMEEGTIVAWLKQDGDPVGVGEDLVDLETDKATMTYTAEAAGVLRILAAVGTRLSVGEPMAVLEPHAAGNGTSAEPASPLIAAEPPAAAPPVATAGDPATVAASPSPVARRLAAVHGVDLARVSGTGPRGRILKRDVAAAAGVTLSAAAPRPAPVIPDAPVAPSPGKDSARGGETVVQPTRVQQLIARRMAETKATVPDFQVETEVAMDAAVELREAMKAAVDGPAPSLNDLVVRACALALRRHPRVNGSYGDGAFVLHARVNVGIAVAAEDALVVPTVFDADTKSIGQIAKDTRRLAQLVREGGVSAADLAGGTFTVSNLGMFGMTAITPVINGSQAAILGVGALRETLARSGGEIVDRRLLTLRLTCDHRIVYGADAAHFLSDVRALLEAPLRMVM